MYLNVIIKYRGLSIYCWFRIASNIFLAFFFGRINFFFVGFLGKYCGLRYMCKMEVYRGRDRKGGREFVFYKLGSRVENIY